MEAQIWTIYLCFWLAVFGAALGSFLDCAVSRWAEGRPPFRGRSRCGSCGHTLGAGDLVPVFGFLLRRGRCKYCGARIPAECLIAELAGAAAFVCLGARFGLCPELGQWLLFAALLLALSLTDQAKRIIPDRLLLALAVNRAVWFFLLGQGVREALEAVKACAVPAALLALVLGLERLLGREALEAVKACAVPAALLALVLGLERLLGREAMGGGDIKLLFALALYLRWAELVLTLLAGCLLGLLWAGLTRRKKGAAMPFGPFLAAGAALTVCCGGPVLNWYFGLF